VARKLATTMRPATTRSYRVLVTSSVADCTRHRTIRRPRTPSGKGSASTESHCGRRGHLSSLLIVSSLPLLLPVSPLCLSSSFFFSFVFSPFPLPFLAIFFLLRPPIARTHKTRLALASDTAPRGLDSAEVCIIRDARILQAAKKRRSDKTRVCDASIGVATTAC